CTPHAPKCILRVCNFEQTPNEAACNFLQKPDAQVSMQFQGPFASLTNHALDFQLRLDRMTGHRTIWAMIAFIAWVALMPVPQLVGADSGASTSASLSADQVVDNLVRRNN